MSPAGVKACLAVGDVTAAWQRIDEFEAARAAGCDVDAGLLVDAITIGFEITAPKAKVKAKPTPRASAPRYGLYKCPTCGKSKVHQSHDDRAWCRQPGCDGIVELVRKCEPGEIVTVPHDA